MINSVQRTMKRAVKVFSEAMLRNNGIVMLEQDLHFDQVVFNPYSYEQQLVKTVVNGQSRTILSIDDLSNYFGADRTIKVEGMERLSEPLHRFVKRVARWTDHDGPVSCHLFSASVGSESFPTHTDPDDVFIYVVTGTKHMEVDGKEYKLLAGQAIFIPHDVPHRALNTEASIMLSVGLERYILEKLA